MCIRRLLPLLVVFAVVLAITGHASQAADCLQTAPSAMAEVRAMDSDQSCDDMAPSVELMAACDSFCLAPVIAGDGPAPHRQQVVFAAMQPIAAMWRDRDSSPDPHPPKSTPRI